MTDFSPFQTPPKLKNAAGLSTDFEYATIWTGQSNSRPWGYPADGIAQAPALELEPTGLSLTSVTVPDLSTRQVGEVEVLTVDSTVEANKWNTGTWLRLGTPTAPLLGYAKVLKSGAATLTVKWVSLPVNGAPTVVAGYLVREEGNFAAYDNVRVLTPYLPIADISPPVSVDPAWTAPQHAPYPAENGKLAVGGRRLILPAPYTLPSAVTTFEDLGLFLPLTRREGADGYGISEIADSTYNGTGDPTGHPVTLISGQVFTFQNSIPAGADLTRGYLLVDWESANISKRSWARIASNTTTTFTADSATWLGDGIPATPGTSTVTFDLGTDEVIWTGHILAEGERVVFTTTGALPTELTAGTVYYVRNPITDRFQVSVSPDHATLGLSGAPSGTNTGTRVWLYTAWIPHWKDNPHMWLPGPEFARANEDQQPQSTILHWRARGQLRYYHRELLDNDPLLAFSPPLYTPFDGEADSRFGALLPFAWRMSTALGKRINVVALGVNSTGLMTLNLLNPAAYPGVVGWWDGEKFGYSLSREDTQSVLSNRIKKLLTVIAPAALLAEGNSKSLRVLATCHVQGETDAALDTGRELYAAQITDYKRWLRDLVSSSGFSPFEGEAQMPFVQPMITYFPWEFLGTGVSFQAFGFDQGREVNNAIKETQTADEFADYVQVEDLPKLAYTSGAFDFGHFSGQGMSALGARLAKAALDTLEHALSYSSAALTTSNARLLRIANLALTYIGQGARRITSLAESTTEATLVSMMLPETTRQLLSMRQWSWALRTEPATQVHHDNTEWLYAYVVPGRAMTPLAIMPPPDESTSTHLVSVLSPSIIDEFPIHADGPEAFEIGQSPSGHRLLYTNVPQIEGLLAIGLTTGVLDPQRLTRRALIRYVDKVVDPDFYSESFATALTWLLAASLAPALVKGQEGEAVATRCMQKAAGFINVEAKHESASRQRGVIEHRPTWIDGR